MTDSRYTKEILSYQDALWDFMLEHSDLLPSGAMFIKFHIDDRHNFENRILSRWKYNYHRLDVNAKEAHRKQRRDLYMDTKRAKREKWKANKEERRRILLQVKRKNRVRIWVTKLLERVGIVGKK